VEVQNPYEKPSRPTKGEGMGLETLKKRINMYYDPPGKLIIQKDDNTFQVKLRLPINQKFLQGGPGE
jgi:sensor histidine kinase YesM